MQVRAGPETDGLIAVIERRVRVGEVLLILAYLNRGMLPLSKLLAHPGCHEPVRLRRLTFRPLFRFDDDGLVTLGGIAPANHEIEAPRGARQLVIDDDSMVHERRELHDLGHFSQ